MFQRYVDDVVIVIGHLGREIQDVFQVAHARRIVEPGCRVIIVGPRWRRHDYQRRRVAAARRRIANLVLHFIWPQNKRYGRRRRIIVRATHKQLKRTVTRRSDVQTFFHNGRKPMCIVYVPRPRSRSSVNSRHGAASLAPYGYRARTAAAAAVDATVRMRDYLRRS